MHDRLLKGIFIFGLSVLLLAVAIIFGLIMLGILFNIIHSNSQYLSEMEKTFQFLLSVINTFIFGALSVYAPIVLFSLNRRSNRNQHTFSVLIDFRMSTEFRETLEKRRAMFPEYQDITFDDWNAARLAKPASGNPGDVEAAAVQTRGAQALASLLNYYEFLAIGIENGDLDEAMLKQSVRGIMCNLVDDARLVIATMQQKNPKTYEHLAQLYHRWRMPNALDIKGNPNERPIPKA